MSPASRMRCFTGLAPATGMLIARRTCDYARWNSRAKVIRLVLTAGAMLAASLPLSSNAPALTFKDVQAIESNYNQLYSIGRFREAVPMAEQLADAVKTVFGTRHPNYTPPDAGASLLQRRGGLREGFRLRRGGEILQACPRPF